MSGAVSLRMCLLRVGVLHVSVVSEFLNVSAMGVFLHVSVVSEPTHVELVLLCVS